MRKTCEICNEAAVRLVVDQQLRDNVPIRDIASLVSRSKSSVGRHKLHGARERPNAEGEQRLESSARSRSRTKRGKTSPAGRAAGHETSLRPVETVDDVRARFQHLLDEATAIVVEARQRGDSRLTLEALKRAEGSLTALGRAMGLLQQDGAINLNVAIALGARSSLDRLLDDVNVPQMRLMQRVPRLSEADCAAITQLLDDLELGRREALCAPVVEIIDVRADVDANPEASALGEVITEDAQPVDVEPADDHPGVFARSSPNRFFSGPWIVRGREISEESEKRPPRDATDY